MGKGKRKRQREERREGKGVLAERDRARKEQREHEHGQIAAAAVANGPPARPSPTLRVLQGGGDPAPLEDRPEYVANMQAWHEAGCPVQR